MIKGKNPFFNQFFNKDVHLKPIKTKNRYDDGRKENFLSIMILINEKKFTKGVISVQPNGMTQTSKSTSTSKARNATELNYSSWI